MRVRVAYTVDVDDEDRDFINRRYGRPGLANREETRRFFQDHGEVSGYGILRTDRSLAEDAARQDAERETEGSDESE